MKNAGPKYIVLDYAISNACMWLDLEEEKFFTIIKKR
jgi:hypothetical protein